MSSVSNKTNNNVSRQGKMKERLTRPMKEKYKVNQSSTADRLSRKQKTNRQTEEEKKNDQSIQVLKRKKVVKERGVQNNGGLKQALQAAGFRNVDG